ncbi:DUF2510 domain-containing protein [Wenjunlia vitaminophila]|uniref:DUF2510 domain-containing protein n=1 Tax=Wenjunlia vitaminophila TaxID=76728 RepID=UPI00039EA0A3|nr:DUF2510 domain-containing protein [Wenjunlia vitaminophila]
MTATRSGWYPDPHQAGGSGDLERWWDGTSWTEYTRTKYTPPAEPTAPFGAPGPAATPPRGRRGGRVAAAVAAGALLVGGAVVGGVVLLGGDDDGGSPPNQAEPSASVPADPPGQDGNKQREPDGQPPQEREPTDQPGRSDVAVDSALGISLPVPEGFRNQSTADRAYVSTDPYQCATSDSGVCVSAGAYTLAGKGTIPRAAAERDIAANAADAYGEIKGHRQVRAERVTVAGKEGYLVRWTVDAAKGPDGVVQTVAFPSPVSGTMTIVRLGFDDTDRAPELSVMDTIVEGIRAAGPKNGV